MCDFFYFGGIELKIVIGDAKFFKNLLTALSVLGDEVTFTANKEGLSARFMDASHCAMVDFLFPKQSMDEFNYADCLEGINFTVNVAELQKSVLKDLKKDTSIVLEVKVPRMFPELPPIEVTAEGFPELPEFHETEGEGFPKLPYVKEEDKAVSISLRDRMVRNFKVPLLEGTVDDLSKLIPKLNQTVLVKIITDDLYRAIENAESYSDNMSVTAYRDRVEFFSKGDLGQVTIPFDKGSESLLCLETRFDGTKANYSLNYLKEIVKAIKVFCDIITLEYDKDMPLKMTAELHTQGLLRYYLAPRIDAQ